MQIQVPLALLVGLSLGGIGTYLFIDSIPPPEKSTQAVVDGLKRDLTKERTEVKRLTALIPKIEATLEEKSRDSAAAILQDLKTGRTVDVNRVYKQVRPVMRDISPIFDHLRRNEMKRDHARLATHMAEAYRLTEAQKKALEQWLGEEALRQQEAFNALVYSDSSTFEDFVRASRYQREDKGLDEFMERTLRGPELEKFRTDRLTERAHSMENRANHQVDQITSAVGLTEAQGDQLFGVMVRSSADYDARMKLQNVGSDKRPLTSASERDLAIRGLLRPDQWQRFDSYRAQRRAVAERELREMGLSLPSGWDFLDENW
jgi:hypothetical protein